jgi:hypothetical protein
VVPLLLEVMAMSILRDEIVRDLAKGGHEKAALWVWDAWENPDQIGQALERTDRLTEPEKAVVRRALSAFEILIQVDRTMDRILARILGR